MEARPCTDSVFQLQDAQLMVEAKAFYRLYRFVLVRRSSWNFKSSNYVADSRRRSKLKFLPSKSKHQISIISQLIPTEQLLFLLWCKSSKTVIMPSGHSPQRNTGSTNTSRIAASSNRILKGADLASRPPHGKTSTKSKSPAPSSTLAVLQNASILEIIMMLKNMTTLRILDKTKILFQTPRLMMDRSLSTIK